jgi:pimeloyl-ACP methyl ester carboxylesterase
VADSIPVLFVHGLWMNGTEGLLLRHRLATYDCEVETFRYGSMSDTLSEVVPALVEAIERRGRNVRLLGHSLGGLVILRALAARPEQQVGSVVLLGSPVNGSRAAEGVARLPGSGWFMGKAAAAELLAGGQRAWTRSTPLGVIAGDMPMGVGSLISDLAQPHDGAVSVAETRLTGATAHRTYHVNHMGLLASSVVAQSAASFLRLGKFPD